MASGRTSAVNLEGQVAVVTGGSRGIGRAIAEAYLAAGASVVINGRNADKGAQAIAEMAAEDRTLFVAGNVQDQGDVENLIASAIARFGRIDILVNNAGGSSGFAPVADLSDEAWQEAAAWILHSAFWATRAALKDMQTRGYGRIINISSVEGRQANKASVSHYITFKHALNGFTKAVAFEYGSQGITSNAISPGAVETDLMRESGPAAAESMGVSYEQFKQDYADDAAIKRLNTVQEIAATALLLASVEGGGITGAIVPVDGGTGL
ncbi:MAG: SDR family oxidoreductase [Pseudomonadaceae bacterium]|nr:SDR family oxidoreductase [Pseudomonadaceae bacterium]